MLLTTATRILAPMRRLREATDHHPRLAAIARAAGIDQPIATAELDRLIARGWVRRGYYDDRSFVDVTEQHWRRTA